MRRPAPPTCHTGKWPACNEALKRRSSPTIWFDPEMIWAARPTAKRGRQPDHSDAAIRACLQIGGTSDGNRCTLAQRFRYDIGRVQNRQWTLTLGHDGSIATEAPDVAGTGNGQVAGAAVQMQYRIRLDAQAGNHLLDVTDWT